MKRTSTLVNKAAVRYLFESGQAVEVIAETQGITVARVWEIVREAKPKQHRPKPSTMGDAREAAMARDRSTCRLAVKGTCRGDLHAHHVRFRSRGGSDDPANLIVVCRFHHDAIHAHPDAAWETGLAAHAADEPNAHWERLHANGLAERSAPSPAPDHRDLSSFRCEACGKRGVLGLCDACDRQLATGRNDSWD